MPFDNEVVPVGPVSVSMRPVNRNSGSSVDENSVPVITTPDDVPPLLGAAVCGHDGGNPSVPVPDGGGGDVPGGREVVEGGRLVEDGGVGVEDGGVEDGGVEDGGVDVDGSVDVTTLVVSVGSSSSTDGARSG